MPKRVQMHRRKGGWRKDHPEAVIVARPSEWGNPYRISDPDPHQPGLTLTAETATAYYWERFTPEGVADIRNRLRGRDLACWCPLDQPCHADVLLHMANTKEP